MDSNLVTIKIHDKESLLSACDILHDATFDLSTLQFDKKAGVLTARFEREFFEDATAIEHEPKLFVLDKATFPLVDSELTLTEIMNYEIEDKSKIGTYMFNECKIDGSIATLFFCEDMRIVLTFKEAPQGSLVDNKILDKEGSFYSLRNPFKAKDNNQ